MERGTEGIERERGGEREKERGARERGGSERGRGESGGERERAAAASR